MQGTIQSYVLYMADDVKKEPLKVKQCDTNSRWAKITLKAFEGEYWLIPFDVQIYLNVHKADGTLATATCTKVDEHTVLAPITEQMTAVTGTQSGELYFLAQDGDIKSQTFPIAVYPMVMDQARIESSDDFQSMQDALREVKTSTEAADIAAQYATEQGNSARDGAQRANDAADSIQVAVDAAAAAKACESNAKDSETAAAQAQQDVTDYVEAQKAAFAGYSKRESDSKYANALTETATGEGSITVEDAWTAPVLGLEVAGKSEQVVTTGAQLIPYPYVTSEGTHEGITAKTTNGHISISGTTSTGTNYNIYSIPPGDYAIKIKGIHSGMDLKVHDPKIPETLVAIKSSQDKAEVVSNTFIVPEDHLATLYFNQGSANISVNIDVDIMLTESSKINTPYEPYTGGAPSPSPDYPQDIISVGTVSVGTQLIIYPFQDFAKSRNGVTYTDNGDGTITVDGTATTDSYTNININKVLPPGTYTLSGCPAGGSINGYSLCFGSAQKADIGQGITVTEIEDNFNIYIRIKAGTTVKNLVFIPMLNAGNTALLWEPYTGGKPSPSAEYPQELEVGVTGAQLLNASKIATVSVGGATLTNNGDGSFTVSGSGTLTGTFTESYTLSHENSTKLFPTGVYTLTRSPLYPYLYVQAFIDGITVSQAMSMNSTNMTTTEKMVADPTYRVQIGFYGATGQRIVPGNVLPVINTGDTALSWEPYAGYQTTPITLTEPLRGIGDYRDRIICRDGVWGIEREFIKIIFDGSENWKREQIIGDIFRFKNTEYRSVIKSEISINRPIKIMCDRLVEGSSSETFYQKECISSDTTGQIYIYLNAFVSGDLDAFKIYLSSHPITAIFERATPTWEPFPDATQQALNALTTYAGTTHLTITAGGPAAEVTLEYVKDTHKALEQCQEAAKEYTDNQIAAIVAALPTASQAAIVDNQTTRLLQEV